MKRILLIGLSLLVAGLCLLPTESSIAQTPTTVEITPASQTVDSDETFTVSVYVTPDELIQGLQFDLSFNATLLQANSVTEGNLLNQGCSTFFAVMGTIDNTAGTITGVAGSTLSNCNISNAGTFANISFTARDVSGISFLNLSNVVVGGPNGSVVSIMTNGSVTVVAPGITVNPTTGLITTEAGGTDTFTIVLDKQPTASVTIGLTSSDTTEGTVSPSSVTFTTVNWNSPRTVTVTGVNDALADGDIPYTIVTAAATSGDADYNGMNAADVSVTNIDNDVPGITVNPTSGLVTTEAGGTATFTVVLNTQPSADVVIGLTSSDTTEGTVSPSSVTFTTANWNSPRTVTATGVDDYLDDGNIAYTIVTAAATSTDPNYNGINPSDVGATNNDNDVAGITVTPTSGLTTTEFGGTATFTVVLNTQPSADVVIGLTSSDTSEGTVSPSSVTFTTANWDDSQTVTATGVNDAISDGDIPYTIVTAAATSADPNYNGTNPSDVGVTNTDNDVVGITVNPTSGLVTTEAGGSDTFTIVLNTQPTANVVIGLSSSDTTEGTVSPSSVTFTTANWDTPQTVTATGVNDAIDDGNIAYTIVTAAATSTDPNYNGINPSNVSVTNTDDDVAGITVNPTTGLITSEAGGSDTFTIVLNTQPTANVVVGISSSDTSEGTVSPSSVTFTTANWDTPQTVTATGVNDAIDDSDIVYTIVTAAATSTDPNYSGLNPSDVGATNTDDDTAGITVNPTSGLFTTESGGTATFTIVLNTQPTASVTIGLTSSDTSEGTVSPSSVTFTTSNWNTPRTVTVTGVNDDLVDGDVPFTIVTAAATSTDVNYNGLDADDVSVTNTDNDTPGITVNPTSGLVTTENGDTDTFTVVLNTQPTADVIIGLSSSDTSEGTVSPSSVTFTNANWNTPQTVTITGVNDDIDDGDIAYTVITAAATSTDPNYNGLNPVDVGATNTDDDVAGITVNPTWGLVTTEAGGSDTFTVVLNTEPTDDVVIGLSSSDTSEGTVSPSSVTFTTANWDTPQTVTATGVNDALVDGNIAYIIITAAATSTDPIYNGMNPADVSAVNLDTPGITVTPTAGLFTTESGGTATFTIVLNTQPAANVVVGLSSSNTAEGTIAPSSVTFTTANWNTPQTATITGVNDDLVDGNIAYSIVTAAATSSDPNYDSLAAADVAVANSDNDSPGITVNPTLGLITTEAGGIATFSIVLNTQPTDDVIIGLTSSNTNEGTVSPSSVTFTNANWNTPQLVIVTGIDDLVWDGNIAYTIDTAAATSTDPNYNGLNPSDVGVTNIDNDVPGITANPTSGLVTTEAGGTDTFTVVLNTQPTDDVIIGLTSSNTNEGTVSPSSVTFTNSNWNTPQTITITGVNDGIADGNTQYSIITETAASTDPVYNGLNPDDVSVTNTESQGGGGTGGGSKGSGAPSNDNWGVCIDDNCVRGTVNFWGTALDNFWAVDDDISIYIPKHTEMKGPENSRLDGFKAEKLSDPPSAPSGYQVLAAFNFDPDGATFDPGITINIKFDEGDIPAGKTPVIAYYNETTGEWEFIEGTIQDGQAVFTITHCSIYGVLVQTAPVPPSTPSGGTPTPTPVDEGGGLGVGAIVGIVLGVVIVLALILWLLSVKTLNLKPRDTGKK